MPLSLAQAQALQASLQKIYSKTVEIVGTDPYHIKIAGADSADLTRLIDRAAGGDQGFTDNYHNLVADLPAAAAAPAAGLTVFSTANVVYPDQFQTFLQRVEKVGLLERAILQLKDISVPIPGSPELAVVLEGVTVARDGADYKITVTGRGPTVRAMIAGYLGEDYEDRITCGDNDVVTLNGFERENVELLSKEIENCGTFEWVVRELRSTPCTPEEKEILSRVEIVKEGEGYKLRTASYEESEILRKILGRYTNGFTGTVQSLPEGHHEPGVVLGGLGNDHETRLKNLKAFSDRVRGAQQLTLALNNLKFSKSLTEEEREVLGKAVVVRDGNDYKFVTDPSGKANIILPILQRYLGDISTTTSTDSSTVKFASLGSSPEVILSTAKSMALNIDSYGKLESAITELQHVPGLAPETVLALRTAKVGRLNNDVSTFDIDPADQKENILDLLKRYTGFDVRPDGSDAIRFYCPAGTVIPARKNLITEAASRIESASLLEKSVRNLADSDDSISAATKKALRTAKVQLVQVGRTSEYRYQVVVKPANQAAAVKTIFDRCVETLTPPIAQNNGNITLTSDREVAAHIASRVENFSSVQKIVTTFSPGVSPRPQVTFNATSNRYEITNVSSDVKKVLEGSARGFVTRDANTGNIFLAADVGGRRLSDALSPLQSVCQFRDGLRKLWPMNYFESNNVADVQLAKIQPTTDGGLELRIPVTTLATFFKQGSAESLQKTLSKYFGRELGLVQTSPTTSYDGYELVMPITEDLYSSDGVAAFLQKAAANRDKEAAKVKLDPTDPVRAFTSISGVMVGAAGLASAYTVQPAANALARIPFVNIVTSPVCSFVSSITQSALEAGATAFRYFGSAGLPGASGSIGVAKFLQDASGAIEKSEKRRLKKIDGPSSFFSVPMGFVVALPCSIAASAAHLTSSFCHLVGDTCLGLADRAVKSQREKFAREGASATFGVLGSYSVAVVLGSIGAAFRGAGMATETVGNILARPAEYYSAVDKSSSPVAKFFKAAPRWISDNVGKAALKSSRMYARERIFASEQFVETATSFSLAGNHNSLGDWARGYGDYCRGSLSVDIKTTEQMILDAAQFVRLSKKEIAVSSGIAGDSEKYLRLPEVTIGSGDSIRKLRPLVTSDGSVLIVDVNTAAAQGNRPVRSLSTAELREFNTKFFEAVSKVRDDADATQAVSLSHIAAEYRGATDQGVAQFVSALETATENPAIFSSSLTETLADGSSKNVYKVKVGSEKFEVEVIHDSAANVQSLRIRNSGKGEYRDLSPVAVDADGRVSSIDPDVLKITSLIAPETVAQASVTASAGREEETKAASRGRPAPSLRGATAAVLAAKRMRGGRGRGVGSDHDDD